MRGDCIDNFGEVLLTRQGRLRLQQRAIMKRHHNIKICQLLDHSLTKWQLHFNLKRECSVDESIIAFKGRTAMTQNMLNKLHRWGLVERQTGVAVRYVQTVLEF